MKQDALEATVRRALSGRRLVWFGTRGDDVESLTALPELQAVFTVVNRYSRRSQVMSRAFEDDLGRRVDLDAHDIDDDSARLPWESSGGLFCTRCHVPVL